MDFLGGHAIGHSGAGPGCVNAVYRSPNLIRPVTVAAITDRTDKGRAEVAAARITGFPGKLGLEPARGALVCPEPEGRDTERPAPQDPLGHEQVWHPAEPSYDGVGGWELKPACDEKRQLEPKRHAREDQRG